MTFRLEESVYFSLVVPVCVRACVRACVCVMPHAKTGSSRFDKTILLQIQIEEMHSFKMTPT